MPTALTVQNTRGVQSSTVLSPDLVTAQVAAVLDDLPVAAVKIGMLGTGGNVAAVLDALRPFSIPVVLDPVVRSSSGAELLDGAGVQVLRERGVELALITPNLAEAGVLLGEAVTDPAAMAVALREALGCPVLVTGGHGGDPEWCVDHLAAEDEWELSSPRVPTTNDHGTGCLLSTSIACALARGTSLIEAVQHGRECVELALRGSLELGRGTGPVFLLRAPSL